MLGVELVTKKVVNYSNAPDQYDEPEGILPDGRDTLGECDRQTRRGAGQIDISVVSDDDGIVALQMAKTGDAAGVGYGLFIYDIAQAPRPQA